MAAWIKFTTKKLVIRKQLNLLKSKSSEIEIAATPDFLHGKINNGFRE